MPSSKEQPRKAGTKWNDEDIRILIEARQRDEPYRTIASRLGRTPLSLRIRMNNLRQEPTRTDSRSVIRLRRELRRAEGRRVIRRRNLFRPPGSQITPSHQGLRPLVPSEHGLLQQQRAELNQELEPLGYVIVSREEPGVMDAAQAMSAMGLTRELPVGENLNSMGPSSDASGESAYASGQATMLPTSSNAQSDSRSSTSAQTEECRRNLPQPSLPAPNGPRYAYAAQLTNSEGLRWQPVNVERHHVPSTSPSASNESISPYTNPRMTGAQAPPNGSTSSHTGGDTTDEGSHALSRTQCTSTEATDKTDDASMHDQDSDPVPPQQSPTTDVNSSHDAQVADTRRDARMELNSIM